MHEINFTLDHFNEITMIGGDVFKN